jgi:hypothetical protein
MKRTYSKPVLTKAIVTLHAVTAATSGVTLT